MRDAFVVRALAVVLGMTAMVSTVSAQAVKRALPVDDNGNPITLPTPAPVQPAPSPAPAPVITPAAPPTSVAPAAPGVAPKPTPASPAMTVPPLPPPLPKAPDEPRALPRVAPRPEIVEPAPVTPPATAPAMPPLPPPLPATPAEKPALSPDTPLAPPREPEVPMDVPKLAPPPAETDDVPTAKPAMKAPDTEPAPPAASGTDEKTDDGKGDKKSKKENEEDDEKRDADLPSKRDEPKPSTEPAPMPKYLEEGYTLISAVKVKKDLQGSVMTIKDARTIRLEIAAPRGQIVDRNGVCLAQNRVANYLAVSFPVVQPETDQAILAYAHDRMAQANKALDKTWNVPDDRILKHYRERRWIPMVFSMEGKISIELTPEQIEKVTPFLGKGLMLHPTFVRTYPKLNTACHVIGYTGIRQPLPTGPVVDGEPLIEEPIGKSGLEETFENDLRGKPGTVSLLFNPDGTKLNEEVVRRPVPGKNVVTTLDYDMQRFAEDALAKNAANGGAMVIMDVRNGDVLALASHPTFNPNEFIPRITEARYAELVNDKKQPLYGRAFQGIYPPASTFKVVTALAGLESGAITANTYYECGGSYTIGDRVFHNWHMADEGSMNVVGAIKRSCNTWFYQAGLQTGSANVVAMAERMGFGQPTGLPIRGEAKGLVPTDAFYMQRSGHKILPGILASMCIGQVVTATPLQVAQCMATVADGLNMPKVRLVKQLQDHNDNVVQVWAPDVRRHVDLKPAARNTVVKGMVEVVQGEGGTGHAAQISGVKIAGKTGTAQWVGGRDSDSDDNKRWLAWFTGFLPADNPAYAFAVVYEGRPGETGLSGGKIAAPIVQEVFEKIQRHAKANDPIRQQGVPKAELADDSSTGDSTETRKAESAPESKPEAPPQPQQRPNFFRRLFGGGR